MMHTDQTIHPLQQILTGLNQEQNLTTGLWLTDVALNQIHANTRLATTWQSKPFEQLAELAFVERFDIAVCLISSDQFTIENHQNTAICLTRLRDLLARKVLLWVEGGDAMDRVAHSLRQLGFSQIDLPQAAPDASIAQLWNFNILNYKQVPDWLNAKFWANPERWNKQRW